MYIIKNYYNHSFVAADIYISEGLHEDLAVYVHGTWAHRCKETTLIEIANNRVWIYQLRGPSQIVAVALFSPAAHWAPGGAL